MNATRKPRVPMPEQIKLINECRRSGMTDADWCREHHIAPSTFYSWVSHCRKASPDQILEPGYGHQHAPRPKQDVVPVMVVPERSSEQPTSTYLPLANQHLDNSHTIEVTMKDLTIRVSNNADPALLSRTLRILQEFVC